MWCAESGAWLCVLAGVSSGWGSAVRQWAWGRFSGCKRDPGRAKQCWEAAHPQLGLLALDTTCLLGIAVAHLPSQQPACTATKSGAGWWFPANIFWTARWARCTRPRVWAWPPTTPARQKTIDEYVVSMRGRQATPWQHTEGSLRGAKMPSQTMPVSLRRELVFWAIFGVAARPKPGKPWLEIS